MWPRSMRYALLAAGALLLALGCGEDPVPKLAAERQALLDTTQPKAAFWSEVERKGGYAKRRRELEKERAELMARSGALAAEQEQLAQALAQAGAASEQTAALLAHDRTELARLEAEVAKRESALADFAALTTAPEGTP